MPLAIYTTLESNPNAAIVLSVTLIVISFLVIIVTKSLLGTTPKQSQARRSRS